MTIYDIVYEDDQNSLYNILLNPVPILDPIQNAISQENQTTFCCHVKRGGLDNIENTSYDLVQFTGYFSK
jgi:circadian locomoter output cycles kaput protein